MLKAKNPRAFTGGGHRRRLRPAALRCGAGDGGGGAGGAGGAAGGEGGEGLGAWYGYGSKLLILQIYRWFPQLNITILIWVMDGTLILSHSHMALMLRQKMEVGVRLLGGNWIGNIYSLVQLCHFYLFQRYLDDVGWSPQRKKQWRWKTSFGDILQGCLRIAHSKIIVS